VKKTYVFARDLTVDVPAQGVGGQSSRVFKAGDTIDREDILPGCFESLVRVGDLAELTEPVALDTPPPAAKSKGK
jgi:hypothetical protein